MSSKSDLPNEAEIIIIGGGIVGCSIAYHLAKKGVKDVVLIERKQLTCGTTWHAAGLVSMLWPTPTLTNLAKYCHELYASLESETGQATGYKRIGSVSLARNSERLEELKRNSSMAKVFGVTSKMINNNELESLYPGINTDGVIGTLYIEKDGQTNPIDTTMALAKGARSMGVEIIENTLVDDIIVENDIAIGVRCNKKNIKGKKIILTGGLWSRDIAKKIGVNLPLYACEHYYVVTEAMSGLTPRPVMRDFDKGIYFKEDAGKMLIGWFEKNAIGCPMSKISSDFSFDEFPVDMDHIEPYLMAAMETFPEIAETGIRTFFNGPESFTNDNLHLMGPTPEIENFYVACGMNSKGIAAAGGLGKIFADWLIDGYPSGEITETDVRRNNSIQTTQSYVESRIPEALGHTYAMHWPFYQYQTARNLWQSPLHNTLTKEGACFGEVGGFERANWFTKDGVDAEYKYSYKRQNWFKFYAEEHLAVRKSVGVYDISSFGKFRVTGKNAQQELQYISCANIDVEPGKVVYTQWLNERGGIEADVTIARLNENTFDVITSISSLQRDWSYLQQNLKNDTQLTNITLDYGCLSVQGPQSRSLLQGLVDVDLSNDHFKFSTGKYTELLGLKIWIQKLSYVGELGWELFIPSAKVKKIYLAIKEEGKKYNIRDVGMHALNSLRLEKGYRHWGHDIAAEDNLIEAGLSFIAKPDVGDFIGKDAFLYAKSQGLPARRLVQFKLDDPEPLLYHNEPIVMNEDIVGYLSSAMYGHSLGRAIGMGYVKAPALTTEKLNNANFEIEIATERYSAQASLRSLYDPNNEKLQL
ncbi:MAG: FAD-dependent oxidoreductase [Woeseiaceae bacterium]|jgi:4-methylaminobutanoate oxidase (formaldehyde-forming)|nr:FAD-dependent oxidoreductase [Woeseiaceae bacterium]MDG1016345.1 FAD-dependent oxidoreductase [Woeseiaceae bacterium]